MKNPLIYTHKTLVIMPFILFIIIMISSIQSQSKMNHHNLLHAGRRHHFCHPIPAKPPPSICYHLHRICFCPRQPPPPDDVDPRFGVEKRLVPSGPNPLHNWTVALTLEFFINHESGLSISFSFRMEKKKREWNQCPFLDFFSWLIMGIVNFVSDITLYQISQSFIAVVFEFLSFFRFFSLFSIACGLKLLFKACFARLYSWIIRWKSSLGGGSSSSEDQNIDWKQSNPSNVNFFTFFLLLSPA